MDTTTPIEEALHQDTFDVLSFVEDVAYPVKKVTVYKDVKSAKELVNLLAERLERESTEGPITDLDDKIADAEKRVNDSALIFTLRGYAPGIVDDLTKAHTTEEDPTGADAHLVAHSIVSVENSKGQKDEHVWSAEEVNKFRRNIQDGEYAKILGGVADVLFNAAIFERAADAGFLSERPDVAPEL